MLLHQIREMTMKHGGLKVKLKVILTLIIKSTTIPPLLKMSLLLSRIIRVKEHWIQLSKMHSCNKSRRHNKPNKDLGYPKLITRITTSYLTKETLHLKYPMYFLGLIKINNHHKLLEMLLTIMEKNRMLIKHMDIIHPKQDWEIAIKIKEIIIAQMQIIMLLNLSTINLITIKLLSQRVRKSNCKTSKIREWHSLRISNSLIRKIS